MMNQIITYSTKIPTILRKYIAFLGLGSLHFGLLRLLIPLLLLFIFAMNIPSLWAEEAADATAMYRVTFESTWSQETHPHPSGAENFPTSNAHFSGIVGATHNADVSFWELDELASDGIEEMAETGGKETLIGEVQAAVNAGSADQVLSGPGLSNSPDSLTYEFTASNAFPMVTLVSMIAPSPDWFVGVDSLLLQDGQGEWINQLVVELVPYDAGTDDGLDYRSSNADSDPAQTIGDLAGVFPFSSAPIGTFTFERLDLPEPTATPTAAPVQLPDLAVTLITPQLENEGCLSDDNALGYRVTIVNNGMGAAGEFVVMVNGTPQTVAALAAGASLQLWFTGLSSGMTTVAVDPDNVIVESDESNNLFEGFLPIPTPPPTCTATPTSTPIELPTIEPTATLTPTALATAVPSVEPTAMLTPTISIISPLDNAVVDLPFMLEVHIKNWVLQPEGQHYHWMVDGVDQGPIYSTEPFTISSLTPGSHLITVALAEPDHRFIDVDASITIVVAGSVVTETPTPMPSVTSIITPTVMPTSTTQAPIGVESESAQYQITFTSTWSNVTHPYTGTFPSNAHYSRLFGVTHNEQVSFWAMGGIATDGIEEMAETGGTSILRTEIQAAIDGATAGQIVSGGGLSTTPGTISTGIFTATKAFPLLTLVTMIAPSPDWFVGVHDTSLLDVNGQWRTGVSVDLFPYDAGTDDGADYTSANADSAPPQPIRNLTGVIPFSTEPLGTFTITRVDEPAPDAGETKIYLSILMQ